MLHVRQFLRHGMPHPQQAAIGAQIVAPLRNSGRMRFDREPAGRTRVPEHRASTTDDLPNRSSLMRVGGVSVANMDAGLVTADALSSMAICMRSFGSRTRKHERLHHQLASTLKEYCTVEKVRCTENSRRTRTHSAVAGSAEKRALCPASTKPGLSVSVVRPRETSKSS